MSDDSDAAGPPQPQRQWRKKRRLDDSSSPSTSAGNSPPQLVGAELRRRPTRNNPIAESSSESDSDSPFLAAATRRRKRPTRVPSDTDSSGSSIILPRKKKRALLIPSDSNNSDSADSDAFYRLNSASATTSQWETDFSDSDHPAEPPDQVKAAATQTPLHIGAATASAAAAAMEDSDSSDGQSEKCPICLIAFRAQEIGTPETCEHTFCLECIQEWSKNMNTCPVDRQEYNRILVRATINEPVTRQIAVERPQPRTDDTIVEDPTFCEVCGSPEHENRMLLCDGCDLGYHMYCLTPPLDEIPTGSWFCHDCTPEDVVSPEIEMYEIQLLLDEANEMMDLHAPIRRRRFRY